MAFRTLSSDHIITTLERLEARIRERFPDASLNGVVKELVELGKQDRRRAERLSRPYVLLRLGILVTTIAAISALVLIGAKVIGWVEIDGVNPDIFTVFEGVEAGLNIVILAGVAIFALSRVEERLKRDHVLKDLHELRSMAHVIDMHQLTKDPAALLRLVTPTSSSPPRVMSDQELSRYLDYCSELLSLAGKIAALYAQRSRDPVVIASVNDIETLTSNMSAKIWQKILIVRDAPETTPQK